MDSKKNLQFDIVPKHLGIISVYGIFIFRKVHNYHGGTIFELQQNIFKHLDIHKRSTAVELLNKILVYLTS